MTLFFVSEGLWLEGLMNVFSVILDGDFHVYLGCRLLVMINI
jgi:hypothetical protein